MKRIFESRKKGAASFYIVAFSTLILVIIASGFAIAVLNEVTRTSNDDLSQSAYDSALAGIEDAKLAFMNYQRCKKSNPTGYGGQKPNGDNTLTCAEIIYIMENPDYQNCYMVGRILGRIGETEEKEVLISDIEKKSGGNVTNNLNQAYTCVELSRELRDYRGSLTSGNNSKVVKIELAEAGANQIQYAKIKWYSQSEQTGEQLNFQNIYGSGNNWRVAFQPVTNTKAPTPPVIQVGLVQTANRFYMEDFLKTNINGGGLVKTNRANVTLVPTGDKNQADSTKTTKSQWVGAYNVSKNENIISQVQLAKSNMGASNQGGIEPTYTVYCDKASTSEFACETKLALPAPYNAANPYASNIDRNKDTFMFVITLPYGQPDTDFAIEVYCAENVVCSTSSVALGGGDPNIATLSGVQVNVDSTGRANDLFRRVETRLESADASFQYPLYGIQLLENDTNKNLINKRFPVTAEHSQNTYGGWQSMVNSWSN